METPFYIRKNESNRVRGSHGDKVPIVVKKSEKSDLPQITKSKFLVSKDLIFGNFVYVLRKHIKLTPEHALFVFINNTLVPNSMTIDTIDDQYRNPDGFVYATYSSENTFG
jgi:GABA(A) receptor-associated protein